MSKSVYKEITGIIGGVGPEATTYFTSLLITLRVPYVSKDQDHIPYLLYNNPQIPARMDYLLKQSDVSPVPEMIRTGLILKKAGATFLVITCNAAHTFAKEIEESVGLPVINMIDETTAYVHRKFGDNATIGVLAATGTLNTQLYQKSFSKLSPNIRVIAPDEKEQEGVMQAIFDIKSNSVTQGNTQVLYSTANNLLARGASVIILGCTEIPLALKKEKCHFFRIDPMEILAEKVIERTILSKTDKPISSYEVHTHAHR